MLIVLCLALGPWSPARVPQLGLNVGNLQPDELWRLMTANFVHATGPHLPRPESIEAVYTQDRYLSYFFYLYRRG